ncbi:hypothetical protein [Mucilaginibacter flavidus]|uniref:hypothetical protein n=1 Tax=Mucilaginibacter flavidus TaxID=2949309 RepID=UPI0020934D97|nr:hypothetical protein [Mucilaginibacter flavidus]MCO5947059.1 hypothetical protein [Mucilaginibacter flavidus]
MEIYFKIWGLIGTHLIKGIFISVLVIILARKFFKNIDFNNALSIIKWILIFYAILNLASFVVLVFLINGYSFWNEATGPYNFAYWLMLLGSFSPFFLFFKKLDRNVYLILLVAILTNIGWLLESFVIHIISFHRDYSGDVNGLALLLPFNHELVAITEGFFLGCLVIIIGSLPIFKRAKGE